MIKLIKNLKQGQNVEMVKGCQTDFCSQYDGGSRCNLVDTCVIDYGSCANVDQCYSTDYYSDCANVDICNSDFHLCGGAASDMT